MTDEAEGSGQSGRDGTVSGSGDGGVLDPEVIRTRAEYGAQLDRLRKRSGLSLRKLAGRIDSSASTLSDWCRGKRLPLPSQHGVLRRLLVEVGVSDADVWVDALRRVRDVPSRRQVSGDVPYPGLRSFGRGDASLFFGRNDLATRATKRLWHVAEDEEQRSLLWVVGPSGAGKSSLLHAGLEPVLESSGYTCVSLTPGTDPVGRLAEALASQMAAEHFSVVEQRLRSDPMGWPTAAQDHGDPSSPSLVLVVDQFEELFRECRDETERQVFVSVLDGLTAPRSAHRCAVVAGLRIDFYAAVAAWEPLAESLQDAQVIVSPMNGEQLTAAIVEPAKRCGFEVEENLVNRLLNDFIPSGSIDGHHDSGSLPLLAHALRETWSFARRGRMTVDDYHTAGGSGRAIEESAERIFEGLSSDDQALARQIFVRLVHVEHNAVATRRAASYTELEGLDPGTGTGSRRHAERRGTSHTLVERLIEPFVESRLLTAGESTVEITHEMLLSEWPRLRNWIEESGEALRLHRYMTEAARAWVEADKDPSMLASGLRLEAMRSWAESSSEDLHLNRDEQDYLSASIERSALAETLRRRRARRLRALAGAAASFALLSGSLAVVANRARSDAVIARDEALSRQTALNVQQLLGTDPGLAAQLAVAGYQIAPTAEARSAVLDSSLLPNSTRFLGGSGPTALASSDDGELMAVSNAVDATVQLFTGSGTERGRAGVIDLGDADLEIYALALTPDRRTLIVGDTAPAITLWNVTDPRNPERLAGPLRGPSGPIQDLDITPDGTELAAVGAGDGAFRWNIADPAEPRPLELLPSPQTTWTAAYTPDGEQLAFGEQEGRVQLWDVTAAPKHVADLQITDRPVVTISFSPDGETLATGAQDAELQVWDLSSPSEPAPLDVADSTFDTWVNTTAFSPDGAYAAAGSSDLNLRIWDTSTWTPVQTLPHPAALTEARFLEDGGTLATVSTDGTLRLWDLPSGRTAQMAGTVWSLSFTADGSRLATVSGEEARIWDTSDLTGPTLVPTGSLVNTDEVELSGGGDMSPDGTLLALGTKVGGDVNLLTLSDPADPELAGDEPLGGSTDLVEQAEFSPDGRLLVAGGNDTAIRVWEISDQNEPALTARIDEPTEIVLNFAWSPTNPYLAAPNADGYVYLYDLTDSYEPRLLTRFDRFDSEAYAAAFTPDGNVLAVGGSDRVVILWDITDPTEPKRIGVPLSGPVARLYDLAFHPSGDYLAAVATDGTTWVWDTSDLSAPTTLAVLGPSESPMFAVEFDPAGGMLAASGGDGEVRLWPVDETALIDTFCTNAGDPITEEEWSIYLPDTDYAPPCSPP